MLNLEKYIMQEGEQISLDKKRLFGSLLTPEDLKYNEGKYIVQFTGFIISEKTVLISFPKHYFDSKLIQGQECGEKIQNIDYHIKLLFKTIQKAAFKKSNLGLGVLQDLDSNYPFSSFFQIYSYFQKYGIYQDAENVKKFGYSGTIDWKTSLQKSPLVVNDGKILYLPMVINEVVSKNVFIGKCMAYVIDSTIEKFFLFISFERTNYEYKDIDWSNRIGIIQQLREIEQQHFKDIHKNLIRELIKFFHNENYTSSLLKIKLYTFHLVWEDMVNEYLKNYFVEINENKLYFKETPNIMKKNFNKKRFYPDIRGREGYYIEPDHYLEEEKVRYLFDSKYYQKIRGLDYKQLAYHQLFQYQNFKKTYASLLLPTHRECEDPNNFKVHFQFNPSFFKETEQQSVEEIIIIEQYLNIQQVIQAYL